MMDPADRALLADTVGSAFASGSDGASDLGAADADVALDELGWLDMLAAEPDDAIAIVFENLGRTNATATALDDVVLYALGLSPRGLAVVMPSFGPPPTDRVAGIATARVRAAESVLVFPGDGAGEGAGTVPIGDAAVEPIQGIDPDGHWYRVGVDPALVTSVAGTDAGTDTGNAAVALAQRAISHQIAGASRAMLELARQHALGRVQFGRPVAQFQAVRHRLADAFVAVEALDAALAAAADAPGALSAQAAKAIAGRTARTVATHCQQVLAGVGFTTEHPFHRYLKRTMLLDGLFGSADELVVTIGHTLLSARSVPVLIEL